MSATRDGINSVAYGCIASPQKRNGVLCMFELAGAVQSLNSSNLTLEDRTSWRVHIDKLVERETNVK